MVPPLMVLACQIIDRGASPRPDGPCLPHHARKSLRRLSFLSLRAFVPSDPNPRLNRVASCNEQRVVNRQLPQQYADRLAHLGIVDLEPLIGSIPALDRAELLELPCRSKHVLARQALAHARLEFAELLALRLVLLDLRFSLHTSES